MNGYREEMKGEPSAFESALQKIREGAHYSICGLRMTVAGVEYALTDEQFDIAWDVMDEVSGHA